MKNILCKTFVNSGDRLLIDLDIRSSDQWTSTSFSNVAKSLLLFYDERKRRKKISCLCLIVVDRHTHTYTHQKLAQKIYYYTLIFGQKY